MGENNSISYNTAFLYFRMLLTMVVSLYTSRVVLNSLGVEDYGIYTVVGGVVSLFSILSGSLSAAISRYITFELGKKNFEKLRNVFSTSINIQIMLIAIIAVLLECVGLWYINNKIVIPEARLVSAKWVFQFSIVTFSINLLSVPYNALIIAHEKMSVFAYISIIDCALKLIVAFVISYNPFDRLSYYGLLIMIVGVINRTLYGIYCKKTFDEAKYHFVFDKSLMKEMFSFAGWNFIGAASGILRDQGGTLVVNYFFGPIVNASRAIAMQVNSAVMSFTSGVMTATNPRITKSYASGDREYMMKLIFLSTKFSYYIILFVSLPILFVTPYLLDLWLVQVPEYCVDFVRLSVILAMSETLANSLVTAMLATGNIKKYQIIVGGCQALNFPISCICLYLGMSPCAVFVVAIVVSVLCEMFRLVLLHNMIGLSVWLFLKRVYFNVIMVTLLASILPLIMVWVYPIECFLSFCIFSVMSVFSVVVISYFVGCDNNEKQIIITQLQKLKKMVRND